MKSFGSPSPMINNAISAAIFIFMALLLVTPSLYNLGAIALLLMGLWLYFKEEQVAPPPEVLWIIVPFVVYFSVSALSVLYHGDKVSYLDNPSRFLLLIPVLWLVSHRGFRVGFFWVGVSVGAILALVFALYQRFYMGFERANGFQHPIMFGDLSVLLGFLSLLAALHGVTNKSSSLNGTFFIFAAISGFAASLLSGSRGGWIGFPFILLTIGGYYLPKMSKKQVTLIFGLLITMLVGLAVWPGSGVHKRVQTAIEDVQGYVLHDNANSSLGTRFEFWKASMLLIPKSGLIGLGEKETIIEMTELVKEGKVSESLLEFGHVHNEFLDHWIKRGFLGVVALLALYLLPLWFFVQSARTQNEDVRAFSVAGIVIVSAYIDFGLSQKMFGHQFGVMGYGFLLVVCAGYILYVKKQSLSLK